MKLSKIFSEYWEAITTGILVIIWLVTLQAQVTHLEEDKLKSWSTLEQVHLKVNEIAEAVARVEGRLESKSK